MVACLKDGAGLVIYLFNGNDRDDHQKLYQRETPGGHMLFFLCDKGCQNNSELVTIC